MTRDEMIALLVAWADDAGMGDNGERPRFEIEYDGSWDVTAYSFYDGSGYARSVKNLDDGLRKVIEEIQQEPEKERESEFNSAAWGICRWKHISFDAAKQWLRDHDSE